MLDGLLELSGSPLNTHETFARFVEAHQQGARSADVIPSLFDGEPRFTDPQIARRLYQNLLGLWDAVASGQRVELNPAERGKREKKKKPEPPPPFDVSSDADAGPTEAWVEQAWRYLDELPEGDPRTLERLNHAFENRQDALAQWLDEAALDEERYATARYLLFEVFAMLELGWPNGTRAIRREELSDSAKLEGEVPASLRAYAEEALTESELGDDEQMRTLAHRGIRALWAARKRG